MATPLHPTVNGDSQFFWDGVADGRLLIQRCSGCGRLRHPPRPMCPDCQSLEWEAVESTGRGVVYSFVMPVHPQYPMFDYPYVVGLVELDEGTRIVTNIIDVDPADVFIGMPVEVSYTQFEDGLVLPYFRPTAAVGAS